MTWYVYYDRYTGERRYLTHNFTEIPTGSGRYPDKREAGDWFISVQDAGVAKITEFSMAIDDLDPPPALDDTICDRFGRYDCSNAIWEVPPDLMITSGAAPRVVPPAAARAWVWAAWGVMLAWSGGRRCAPRHRSGSTVRVGCHGRACTRARWMCVSIH